MLENNLKKYKETPEGFKNILGLAGLTATIILTFIIFNNFIEEGDRIVESEKIAEEL